MKSFAFTFVTVLLIVLLGYAGYFAIRSMTNPRDYLVESRESIGDLHSVVSDTESATTPVVAQPTTNPDISSQTSTAPAVVATPASDLKNQLALLAANKVILKKGSKGPAVGYVQQFMNRYFQKSLKIDNDFGATLQADVKKFQAQNKLSQTGQIAQATLQLMILWMNNHPQ